MPDSQPKGPHPGFVPTFESGDRLGKFTIQRFIARGGMGEVFKAWDNDLNRPVAIKTLLAQPGAYVTDPQFRHRFRQEARTISHIEHENVVRVLELGEHPSGMPFIVLPFLEGEDLQKRLARAKGTPLSLEEAIAILLGACRGVDMCHRAGIVHRDLKPGNIFLTEDQETGRALVKVLDFGVAKPRTQDQDDLTADGFVLGTPSFMPPEQARGFSVDARSDQYALGALLYSCLTLRKPYEHVEAGLATREARGRAVLRALRDGQGFPQPRRYVPEIPIALEATILRAMSQEPDDRFPSVFEFSRELLPFASADVRLFYRSYYDATPRPISVPEMSIAAGESSADVRELPTAGLARLDISGPELPTTKSLRKPAPAEEPAHVPPQLHLTVPTAGAGPVTAADSTTAKLSPHVEAMLLTASRPSPSRPDDSTSLAPSQVTATVRDRPRAPPRGALLLAIAGAAVLATIGLVIHRRPTAPPGANTSSPASLRLDPTRSPVPARPSPAPPEQPASVPNAAAGPAAPAPRPESPSPLISLEAPVTQKKGPRVARDRDGHRVTVDNHGRRWALDGSGRRLFQVDAAGNPAAVQE
jgi:serine/threonine protein kinase